MSTKIHPTALVDKSAQIHESAEIGAYTIVGPDVIVGEDCWIGNHVNVLGHTVLGRENRVFHGVSIGEAPQDKKYQGEPTRLELGDRNTIREFCTFNRGTVHGTGIIKIGRDNLFMSNTHIAHDCNIGNNVIFANCVALGGHVVVKDWVTLGGYTIVHQFTVIGEHSMAAGATGVNQDIPPYIMAYGWRAEPKGINTIGLQRRGFTSKQIENIKHAYKVLYRNGMSYNDAKLYITEMAIENKELDLFVEFFNQSTRGIIR